MTVSGTQQEGTGPNHEAEQPSLAASLTRKLLRAGDVLRRTLENRLAERQLASTARAVREDRLTYLSPAKLASLQRALAEVEHGAVAGDIVEFGVALGGSAILMCKSTNANRRFVGYDVFATIPAPGVNDGTDAHRRYAQIAAGKSAGIGGDPYYGYEDDLLSKVKASFERHGLQVDGDRIRLVPGLFEAAVPGTLPDRIAFAHIDCDWFEPVAFCLEQISSRIAPGGILVIDDYRDFSRLPSSDRPVSRGKFSLRSCTCPAAPHRPAPKRMKNTYPSRTQIGSLPSDLLPLPFTRFGKQWPLFSPVGLFLICMSSSLMFHFFGWVNAADAILLCVAASIVAWRPMALAEVPFLLLLGAYVGVSAGINLLWHRPPLDDLAAHTGAYVLFLTAVISFTFVFAGQPRVQEWSLIGLAIAQLLLVLVLGNPTKDPSSTPWNQGLAAASLLLTLAFSSILHRRRFGPMALLPWVLLAALGTINSDRGMLLIACISACGLGLALRHGAKKVPNLRAWHIGALLVCVLGAIAVFPAASRLAVLSGIGPEYLRAKMEHQLQSDRGYWFASRPEFFVALDAALERPLLGYGAAPRNEAARLSYVQNVSRGVGLQDYLFDRAGDSFPIHSVVMDAWIKGGAVGLLLWIVMLGYIARVLVVHVRWAAPHSALAIGASVYLIPRLLFEPGPPRLYEAAMVAVVLAAERSWATRRGRTGSAPKYIYGVTPQTARHYAVEP